MSTPIQPVPDVVLASEFPSLADRPAGTYNAKAKAWADSENAMAQSVRDIAVNAHSNAVAAEERATAADERATDAETAKQAAEDARDAAAEHEQGAEDAKDSAWAAAAALGADPDLFPQPLQPGKVLGAISSSAVGWVDAMRPGDIIQTAQPVSGGWIETGKHYLKSAHSNLFSVLGQLPDKPAGYVWQNIASIDAGITIRDITKVTDTIFVAFGGGYVWRSTDSGQTWTSTAAAWASQVAMAARITDSIIVAVGSGGLCYTSTNAGITWTQRTLPSASGEMMAVCRVTDSIVVATGATGTACRSTDAGLTWTAINDLAGDTNQAVIALDENILVAGFVNGFTRSSDAGLTWTKSYLNGSSSIGNAPASIVHLGGGVVLAVVGLSVLRSEDFGQTWFDVISALHISLNFFIPLSNQTVIAIGVNGYSIRSDDGGLTWRRIPNVPMGSPLRGTKINETSLFAVGNEGMKKSVDIFDYDTGNQFYVPKIGSDNGIYRTLIRSE